jgi:hypothetical protein
MRFGKIEAFVWQDDPIFTLLLPEVCKKHFKAAVKSITETDELLTGNSLPKAYPGFKGGLPVQGKILKVKAGIKHQPVGQVKARL